MAEAAAAPAGAALRGVRIDDVMLAMDVVDTLRRQEAFVARELDEDGREAELTARLRRIYREQGIEVSDETIAEGVKALKNSRFVYTPRKPGLARSLALLWIARGKIAGWLAAVAGLFFAALAGYYVFIERPARIEAERARIELAAVLPKALESAHAEAFAEARDVAGRAKADELLGDGKRALAKGDVEGARAAQKNLAALAQELRRSFDVMVVSRPGERSGIFRIPERNPNARNYYLIVEAIGPDGRPIPRAVTSEEDGKVSTVTKWGLRVDKPLYDRVAADKADDGIVENRKLGEKKRGALEIDWSAPVSGAAITQW
ncbi:DUF6384 family protein [Methylocella sp.]|uniref:DUF6384 family protein n=1 Tax=Methylocella sp. TaxID=1978226 RepID=UPI0037841032